MLIYQAGSCVLREDRERMGGAYQMNAQHHYKVMYNGRSCNAKRALCVCIYTAVGRCTTQQAICSEATLPLFMLAANCGRSRRSDNSSLHHCYVHHEFWPFR